MKNKNTVVWVKIKEGKNTYECVGVLMEDESSHIKIAFNAQNDVARDFIRIERDNVLDLKIIENKKIEVLK